MLRESGLNEGGIIVISDASNHSFSKCYEQVKRARKKDTLLSLKSLLPREKRVLVFSFSMKVTIFQNKNY